MRETLYNIFDTFNRGVERCDLLLNDEDCTIDRKKILSYRKEYDKLSKKVRKLLNLEMDIDDIIIYFEGRIIKDSEGIRDKEYYLKDKEIKNMIIKNIEKNKLILEELNRRFK